MPVISQENLQKLLRQGFPELKTTWVEQFAALFQDLRLKCDSGEISTKALDLRGLLSALHLMEKGISSGQALGWASSTRPSTPSSASWWPTRCGAASPGRGPGPPVRSLIWTGRTSRPAGQTTRCGTGRRTTASAPTSTPSTRRAGPTCTSTRSSAWSTTTTISAASSPLFNTFQSQFSGELYTDLFWLGLEGAVYRRGGGPPQRGAPPRPPRGGTSPFPRSGLGPPRRDFTGGGGVPSPSPPAGEEEDRMEAMLHRYFRRARRSVIDRQWAAWAGRDILYGDKKRGGLVRGRLRRLGRSGGGPAEEGGRKFFWQKKHLFHLGQGRTREQCCGTMWKTVSACPCSRRGAGRRGSRPVHRQPQKLPPPLHPGGAAPGEVDGETAWERSAFQAQQGEEPGLFQENLVRNRLIIAQLSQRLQNTILLQSDVTDSRARRASFSPGWPGGPRPPGPAGLSPAAAERAGRAFRWTSCWTPPPPRTSSRRSCPPRPISSPRPHPLSDPGAGDLLLLRQRLHRPADPPGLQRVREK